jgi:hypothetical protein
MRLHRNIGLKAEALLAGNDRPQEEINRRFGDVLEGQGWKEPEKAKPEAEPVKGRQPGR